jgi:hypothetical protein
VLIARKQTKNYQKGVKMHKHQNSGFTLSRAVLEPFVEEFKHVFPEWSFDKDQIPSGRYVGTNFVTSLAIMDGRMPFYVRPAEWIYGALVRATIDINDRISFNVIPHDNGWVLVTAHHDTILGDIWLAYIKAESVPKELLP